MALFNPYYYDNFYKKYYADKNGENELTESEVFLPPNGHTWGQPIYTWSTDGTTCSAEATCSVCGDVIFENATVTASVKQESTLTEKGITAYHASFENPIFTEQVKEIADIEVKKPENLENPEDKPSSKKPNTGNQGQSGTSSDNVIGFDESGQTNQKPKAKGTVITDEKSKAQYVVTSGTDEKPTVAYKKYIGKASKATVPQTITDDGIDYTVTSIAAGACKNNKKLKTIIIGQNVKTIGNKAFYGCKKLKKITIRSKVLTKVGKKAFKGISKKAKINVPKTKKKQYKKYLKGLAKSIKIK